MMVFFSSRRRHTRCICDWSSDVCSSDLTHGQDLFSSGHGPESRLKNVDPVDFSGPGKTQGPGQCLGLDNLCEMLAAGRGKLFGIRQTRKLEPGRQNNRGSHYRPGQTSSTGFVHPGHLRPTNALRQDRHYQVFLALIRAALPLSRRR